ncbi:MAG: DUF3783 domain-containing protein [Lachnospiraceae bacterium]|nr:DUF3783 domain-containing protein [Lachnospiraceae bacterium]
MSREVILLYAPEHCRCLEQLQELCHFLNLPLQTESATLPESVMLFVGFSDERLNGFLHILKEGNIGPLPLMAMRTAANAGWSMADLYRELADERAALLRDMNGV